MKIRFILIALTVFFFTIKVGSSPVKFYSINQMFGISMRETNSICEDINGFIWSSSKTGVLRLTNDDYRIYHLPYETADVISVKLAYENSKLFAYTNNGQIFSFNPVYDRFDMVANLGKILDNKYLSIDNLLIDDAGVFWIASSAGLLKFQTGELAQITEVNSGRYSIAWFNRQKIILASSNGIWLMDIQSTKSSLIYDNKSVAPFFISTLYFDQPRKKLWIGTISNGLFCFDYNSYTLSGVLESTFPLQPVLAIEQNTDSTLLVGIDGQGIWELNDKGDRLINVYKENADDPSSLQGNGVYDLYCGQDRRVWICTFSGGVSFYDQASPIVNQVTHRTNDKNSLANDDVNGIVEDRWGKLWFATNNGVSCWDVGSNQWRNFYSDQQNQAQVFLSLCEDGKGRIWAGSYSSGVYVLDGKTGRELAHYSRSEMSSPSVSNFILKVYEDSQGDIWLGCVNGEIICYLPEENKFRAYAREPVSSFAELPGNQILLGCSYGLSSLNKQTGEVKKLLLGFLVHDILIIGDDAWICTGGDGLLRYKYMSGEIERFNLQSGLPSNFINSIAYAGNYLWIGTENGLCRLNPRDKSAVAYSSVLPLSHTSFNCGAYCCLKNGNLAWGTNNGAVIFAPKSINEIPSEGKIFFQDLSVSGRSVRDIPTFKLNTPVDSLNTINLAHFQKTISLELMPIGMTSGSKFSWIMEGFDQEWSPPSANRIITYTNIPSGQFTLKIKLYDNSLTKVFSERSIAIKVTPPFWRAAWFLMILFVAVSGVIFLILLYYINSLKRKHTEEKVRFFTNTAHDIRTSLTLIKAPVEELIHEKNLSEAGKYYLQLAIEQARRLTSVVTQLMDFQKTDIGRDKISLAMVDIVSLISERKLIYEPLAKSRNISLEFISDRLNFVTAVDETKMEKVIDNLISNAVKYSNPGSKVLIELKSDYNKWALVVKDQGIGISKEAQRKLFKEFYRAENAINSKIVGSGIGLLLVKNLVAMHGGTITCESQENAGSTFKIVIPFHEVANKPGRLAPVPETGSHSNTAPGSIPHVETSHAGNPSKTMSLLIVEDNHDLRNFMINSIIGEFKVLTAFDGVKAWALITRHMPDLVVSDVMMPNMDGFELCKLMKSTYETSHIPIILLTALTDKTKQLHGLGLGADDYLTKPFDMSLLIQKIKTIIRNREVVREKALKLIKESTAEPILKNELNDKFVKKMLEVAWANISNSEFDKEVFASAMNVSTSLLYKKTKSLTGQSPTDFIKTVRLKHAYELLQTRQHTVTDVSELCGFSSVGYFSTVYKNFFGKSPTDTFV